MRKVVHFPQLNDLTHCDGSDARRSKLAPPDRAARTNGGAVREAAGSRADCWVLSRTYPLGCHKGMNGTEFFGNRHNYGVKSRPRPKVHPFLAGVW